MNNSLFEVKEDLDMTFCSMVNIQDEVKMNWVAEGKHWGQTIMPEGMCVEILRSVQENGRLKETYRFTNNRKSDLFLLKGEVGIMVPLPDNYKSSQICMTKRCHAHIWCGGETSYIRAERMGGKGPNLGLVLTKGSISGYSVERNLDAISNDRGIFILHPELGHFLPGEAKEISWELFWFKDREDFEEKLVSYNNVINVKLQHGVFLKDECTEFEVICMKISGIKDTISITANGRPVKYTYKEKGQHLYLSVKRKNNYIGEITWNIKVNENTTCVKTLTISNVDILAEHRCRFITEYQQYHSWDSALDGAFLIYDNEEKKLHYSENYDHNGGRERVAMGVLLATYLQTHEDEKIRRALEEYTAYIYRELYDKNTGIVYNDVNKNNTWHRLYNYPWMAVFFMERYRLTKEKKDLHEMYQIIKTYYSQGGEKFYAIGIPMCESVELLKENEMVSEADELLGCYETHGQIIAKQGLNYPPHEVNYEQSIVAPAVAYLFQLYLLTDKELYLRAGEEQLKVLCLFNGDQPDYHLYEVGIRHWDGYWFGKRKNYGDTFPHYWSALSGMAFYYKMLIDRDDIYAQRAENSLRGVLSLIHEDGSASCAYVYPDKVNGVKTDYEDPWANDQDWGLYFYMKMGQRYHEV